MKALLCSLISLSAITGVQAATAYEALRVVGKSKGDSMLDRVVEVRGVKGAPQPRTWKVVVADQGAPNGVREFDVQGTGISGERTPPASAIGPSMNMNQLNLDSDGAHTVAEREARKKGYAYDHVSYALRPADSGAPVWELRLVDEQVGNVAILSVAADTGKLLGANGLDRGTAPAARVVEKRRNGPPPVADDGEVIVEEMPPVDRRRRVEVRRDDDEEEEVDKPGNKLTRFADRAGRHIGGAFQKFGDKLERAFGGGSPPPRRVETRRTAPPPPRSTRDANGTEYYRPRD
jgi:hypothetical protein